MKKEETKIKAKTSISKCQIYDTELKYSEAKSLGKEYLELKQKAIDTIF